MRLNYLLILVFLLSGCSFPKIYKNNYDKNITINLKTNEKDGFFTSTEYYFGVNDLDSKCEVDYQGQLELKPGKNKIGVAPGKLTFLLINVYTKTGGSSSSSFKTGTILKPKKGVHYNLDVDYLDSLLDIRLYEIKGKNKRSLKILPIEACQPR
jgi:hypothetical protein